MTAARYAHIGGAIITDHGPMALAVARAMAAAYSLESAVDMERGQWAAARANRSRAQSLADAVAAATQWRRAAGWADPDMADGRRPTL